MARLLTSITVFLFALVALNLADSLPKSRGKDKLKAATETVPSVVTTITTPLPAATTTTPSKSGSGVAIYRFTNRDTETTCILLKTDAVVEVNYVLHNLNEQADVFIPENIMVTGNCDKEDTAQMTLGWTGYSLVLTFNKTPGGDHWYLSNVQLTVMVQEVIPGIKVRGNSLKLYSSGMLIPTPVGKSYVCKEVDIPLHTDDRDRPPKHVHGTLLLRLLQIQPFMYRSENFSTPFECKSQKSFRSETAPIAVGSTLAIAAVLTVSGYGVYRYFKVRNVQYNTME